MTGQSSQLQAKKPQEVKEIRNIICWGEGGEEEGENINNGLGGKDNQGKLKGQATGNAFCVFYLS